MPDVWQHSHDMGFSPEILFLRCSGCAWQSASETLVFVQWFGMVSREDEIAADMLRTWNER